MSSFAKSFVDNASLLTRRNTSTDNMFCKLPRDIKSKLAFDIAWFRNTFADSFLITPYINFLSCHRKCATSIPSCLY